MSKDAQRPEECPLRLYELCKHDGGAGRASKAEVAVNSDTPYEFETANFIGHLLFYVSGLPSSPTDLFKGRKRRTHLIVKVIIQPPQTQPERELFQDLWRCLACTASI